MLKFESFDDVLDFAILQEQAAQQFYSKLSGRVKNPQVSLFYRTLVEEESLHEQQLRRLKNRSYQLKEADLSMLGESGYLAAMPHKADMTLLEAIRFSIKKERSSRMLYALLAERMQDNRELAEVFQMLADQEQLHTEYFENELKKEQSRQ